MSKEQTPKLTPIQELIKDLRQNGVDYIERNEDYYLDAEQ